MKWQRPTFAQVNLTNLLENYRTLLGLLPEPTFFCPMVKANAYGHGDVEVAMALQDAGCHSQGVGLIEEGMRLRKAGIKSQVLLFGMFDERSAPEMLAQALTPVLSDWYELEILQKLLKKPLKVHLKFNTGMNRLGFEVGEAPRLRDYFAQNPLFDLEGICTHLMRGEDAGVLGGESEQQLILLEEAIGVFKGMNFSVHALNSSGLINYSERMKLDLPSPQGAPWPLGARPGLALYGLTPATIDQVQLPLKPVLTWKTQIVKLHRLEVGDRVSYGGSWEAARKSLIGVLPLGYADGYPRVLSNRSATLCHGMRAPAVGTVCMDYFMIDLTDIEKLHGQVAVGDEVVVLGSQGEQAISADELADKAGTISYEVMTHISDRVPREFIK